jgi:YHS domain-containing protein
VVIAADGHIGMSKEAEVMERCPVCDMEVDPQTAPKSEFQGRIYYFSSLACKQEFDENPKEYVEKVRTAGKRS